MIKLQWIASIWCQNDQKSQNYKSNQITINLHRFDVKTTKNVELRRKTFITTQNYESHQITMNCIDLMSKTSNQPKITKVILFLWICIDLTSKRSKMLSYVAKHSKQRKTTKVIKLQWIASIWCQKHQTNAKLQKWSYFDEFASIWRQNDQNNAKLRKWSNYNELHRFDVKTVKNRKTTKGIKLRSICIDFRQNDQKCWVTTQNIQNNPKLQTGQITMNCIDLMSKRSKQRKTTILIKLLWIASIWCQNGQKSQNYESDQIIMHCIDLTSKRSKSWFTSQNYKSNQIPIKLHRFDVKTIKMLSYVAKHSKQRKTTKLVKLQWIASIWCQNGQKSQNYKSNQITINLHRFDVKNDQKCWVTSQNILNNAKLQNWSNYNELHRFDVKTVKNRKTTKAIKLRLICIDLRSKRSKKLSYVPKLQKWSNYNELHWFDVKTFKTFELGRKTTKVIKLQWIASIWCQKHQTNPKLQKWSYFDEFASIWRQNDQNNAKLRKWSNYNALHRFDVKTI